MGLVHSDGSQPYSQPQSDIHLYPHGHGYRNTGSSVSYTNGANGYADSYLYGNTDQSKSKSNTDQSKSITHSNPVDTDNYPGSAQPYTFAISDEYPYANTDGSQPDTHPQPNGAHGYATPFDADDSVGSVSYANSAESDAYCSVSDANSTQPYSDRYGDTYRNLDASGHVYANSYIYANGNKYFYADQNTDADSHFYENTDANPDYTDAD